MAKLAAALALAILFAPFAAADEKPLILVYIFCESHAGAAEQAAKDLYKLGGEKWDDYQFRTQVDKDKVLRVPPDMWKPGELQRLLPLTNAYPPNSIPFVFMEKKGCEVS